MSAIMRVRRNAMLNVVGQATPLVVAVVTIPFMMRWLGPARFGILTLTWVVAGFFNAFDLGLGRATTKFVAEAPDETSVGPIVWSAVSAQLVLGVLAGAALWMASGLLVGHVVRVSPAVVSEARTAFGILAFSPALALVTASLQASFEGAEHFGIVNSLRASSTVVSLILQVLAAAFGFGLAGVVAISIVVQAASLIVTATTCMRVFPSMRTPRIELDTLIKLLRFGGWVAVSGIAGPLLVYADRFAIAAILPVAVVGHYAATQEMVIRLSIIPASVLSALFPVFSAARESDDISSLATRSVRGLMMILVPVGLVVIAMSSDLIRFWLGASLQKELTVPLQLLALGVVINAIAYVPYAYLQASGRPDITAKLHVLELPLHVALVWMLVTRFGLIGAALAWSIRVAVDAIVLFFAAARLGKGWVVRPARALVLAPWAAGLAAIAVLVSSASTFAVRIVATLAICVAIAGVWYVRGHAGNVSTQ